MNKKKEEDKKGHLSIQMNEKLNEYLDEFIEKNDLKKSQLIEDLLKKYIKSKNMNLQKVIALQDESSHWYVIPLELVTDFYSLHEKASDDDYDAQEEFEEKFRVYRIGGSLNNIQLWAEI